MTNNELVAVDHLFSILVESAKDLRLRGEPLKCSIRSDRARDAEFALFEVRACGVWAFLDISRRSDSWTSDGITCPGVASVREGLSLCIDDMEELLKKQSQPENIG